MADNVHPTPADAIALLLNCAQEHIATRVDVGALPEPEFILLGAQGVNTPYGCCEGILIVESRGRVRFDRSQQMQENSISGCDPCDTVIHNDYRVSFKLCAPPFDPASVQGAPPKVDERNDLALQVMNEMWLMFQHLSCCVPCKYAKVYEADHMIINGCATFWVNIRMEHELCC